MPYAKCRICGKKFEYTSLGEDKRYPFCSERCRMVDLGQWFNEEYRVSESLDRSGEAETNEGDDK